MNHDAPFDTGLAEDVLRITGKERRAEGGKKKNKALHGGAENVCLEASFQQFPLSENFKGGNLRPP